MPRLDSLVRARSGKLGLLRVWFGVFIVSLIIRSLVLRDSDLHVSARVLRIKDPDRSTVLRN